MTPEQRMRAGWDPEYAEVELRLFGEGEREPFEAGFVCIETAAKLRADWERYLGPPVYGQMPLFLLEDLEEIERPGIRRVLWGIGEPDGIPRLLDEEQLEEGESDPPCTFMRAVVNTPRLTPEIIREVLSVVIRRWRPYMAGGVYDWAQAASPELIEEITTNVALRRKHDGTRASYLAAIGRADAHWETTLAPLLAERDAVAHLDPPDALGGMVAENRDFVDRVIESDADTLNDLYAIAQCSRPQPARRVSDQQAYASIANPHYLECMLTDALHLEAKLRLPLTASIEWLRRQARLANRR